MTARRIRVALPACISAMLVAPLFVLELVNKPPQYAFPVVLFVTLWVVPFLALVSAQPAVSALRSRALPRTWTAALGLAAGLILMTFWAGLVQDQMPCFLGVPNCD